MGKFIDLTGQRFGSLVVLKKDYTSRTSRWWCKCDCGTIKSMSSSSLRAGQVKSCGCQWYTGRPFKKIIPGTRYGKLTVIKSLGSRTITYGGGFVTSRQFVLVKCDCGRLKEISAAALSHSKSCGCSGRGRVKRDYNNSVNKKGK